MTLTANLSKGLEPLSAPVVDGIERSIALIGHMDVMASIAQTELLVSAVQCGKIRDTRDLIRGVIDHQVEGEGQRVIDALEDVVMCLPDQLEVDEEEFRSWAEGGHEPSALKDADHELVAEFIGNLMFFHGWGVDWVPATSAQPNLQANVVHLADYAPIS